MSYVKPDVVVTEMIEAGKKKAYLPIKDIMIRGGLSGALLGFATTLAFTATVQTKLAIIGALIFPVGFAIIYLLSLELLTGNFAFSPLAVAAKKINTSQLLVNWGLVFIANLIGSLFYGVLYWIAATKFGHITDTPIIQFITNLAEEKTIAYKHLGMDGLITVFVKAILCNWMVTLGAVMAFTSTSTTGKIMAMWLPIFTFFAQGFEHSIVNMFVIPTGILLGANVSVSDWWLWNQIPVTLGNIVGGAIFTGAALYITHRKKESKEEAKESFKAGYTEAVQK